MPELPEVQTVVTTLQPRVVGATIRRVDHLRPDIVLPEGIDLPALVAGRVIRSIDRRGKKIIFTLGDGSRFYIHLGMSGRLSAQAPEAPLLPHTHLILSLSNELVIRFVDPRRFGGVWWLGLDGAVDDGLGPEPLTMTAAQLASRLAGRKRPIKSALLDQKLIAGLGNIYVDESLFAAGIHPLTLASKLTMEQVKKLTHSIKTVLGRAIRHRGSTLRDYRDSNGDSGAFQRLHRVYDRKGKPCATCKTPIERIVLGGRSTHYCPQCQPKSRGRTSGDRAKRRTKPQRV